MALTVYAWVEVITGVDISGIKVKPTESKGLKIKKTGDSTFSFVVNASTTNAQSLSPVSTADLTNWYIPSNNGLIGSNGEYNNEFIKINNEETSAYYYKETFSIKSTTSYVGGLKVASINVTNANGGALSADISKAIRVGIKTNTNDSIKIFAPVYVDNISCQVVDGNTSTVEANYAMAPTKIISSVGTLDEYSIELYVWYEGQDPNFTHANLLNVEEIRISIHFEGIE